MAAVPLGDLLVQFLKIEVEYVSSELIHEDLDSLENLSLHLESVYGHLIRIYESNLVPNIITEEVVGLFRSLHEVLTTTTITNSYLNVTLTGQRGRPRYDLPRNQLVHFIEHGFTCFAISSMFGVSPSTVRRRMTECGLSIRETYSSISDNELYHLVLEGQSLFPNSGYRLIDGWLRQKGLRVQSTRVRQTLREVDPIGSANRWLNTIRRRKYSVTCPQALWHLDGNHKLIRWKLVIHGAIDGYSRVVVFLNCSNNNYAQTVLDLFVKSIDEYGLPQRIRTDKGVENYDVAMFMLTHPQRGPWMKPVLVGKSVHNQRIERLWRDVFQGVTSTYYYLFYHLEDIGLLNPLSEIDLFSLHYIYIPIINHSLSEWVKGWNCHKMSGNNGLSPNQLWIQGLQNVRNSTHLIAQEMFQSPPYDYGIDWYGPLPVEDPDESVVLLHPPTCPLSEADYATLQSTIPNNITNTIGDGSFGFDAYARIEKMDK